MKILDKYILKSYMITFTTVFVILFFIFILQGIWLFIADLAGKDLDFFTIIKFLSFYAPTIVPLVLPLSVLLAGIMTFGSFSENYEFAAMKSAGISLNRAMRMLSLAIVLLSLVTFVFANNVIPNAQYRFLNLRKTIIQQKPAMAIAEGQFNTIGNISIKVDKKSGDNGELLDGVIMHIKNTNYGFGANTVIKSKKGILGSTEDSNLLQLTLLDGNYYENIQPSDINDRKKQPFAKSSFKKYVINIDLSKLNKVDDNQEITSEKMLNIGELKYSVDSLQNQYNKEIVSFSENIVTRNDNIFNSKKNQNIAVVDNKSTKDILKILSLEQAKKVLELAKNNTISTEFSISNGKTDLEYKKKNINSHWIVIHEKFIMAYSCLLMFFIGAPLGAIIRKGGLGLPMVLAIVIFILYHFLNLFGRKLAEEDALPVMLGVWLSSIILTPLAILFTYRATNDIGIMINFDWITDPFKKIISKFNKQNNKL
nr:LptF/LptG family permease [Flavobacterium sp. N2270]